MTHVLSAQALPARVVVEPQSRGATWFVAAIMASCIFLQRFGLPFGNLAINIVGPLGLCLAIAGLVGGQLAFHRDRLLVFGVLLGLILLGTCVNAGAPDPYVGINIYSTLQFVGISAFAVLTFQEPMQERVFFRLVNHALMILAIAGILQFAAQFIGLRIFSFTGYLPDGILAETNWNLEIPLGIGELMKSNGFFLVEPSVMSQFMAMALIIEVLALRRTRHLALFGAGLMLSFSGTGGIVLAVFVLVVAVRLGWRGIVLATAVLLMAALVAGAIILLAPDVAAVLASRLDEFSQPGTSGHMRFVTPFWLLSDLLRREPSLALIGLGGGVSEHLMMPYEYDVNTPVKVGLEFGFPVLACYSLLFLIGQRAKLQSVLVLPGFCLLMFTGGYQQFAPVVFLVTLICSVARLYSTPATGLVDST